jgi:hypothetical protein
MTPTVGSTIDGKIFRVVVANATFMMVARIIISIAMMQG